MLRSIKLAAITFGALLLAAPAQAAPLISTGTGALGSVETNWLLGGTASAFVVNPASPFWIDPAADPTLTAKWLSPTVGGPLGNSGFNCVTFCPQDDQTALRQDAIYEYTLDFTNPNHQVDVQWATDNGAEFYLNGTLVNTIVNPGVFNPGSFVAFSIAAGDFQASNTFRVVVTNQAQDNDGNPTGLLVNIAPVPVPAALPLFVGGLGLLGWLARRRRVEAIPS
jgi:hypothetical protein